MYVMRIFAFQRLIINVFSLSSIEINSKTQESLSKKNC